MSNRNSHSSTGRAPQRSNGIKRREAIMDAAAQIITETGIASLTLHATAKRAGASIGSTYHFFGDKDQLLDALREQHRQAMTAMVADMVETKAEDWTAMSTADVIDALFGKPIRFYADHPFALDLHQLHEESAADTFLAIVETVMTLRMGPARGPEIAQMLYAISTGTLAFVLDHREPSLRGLVGQIPLALTAYLTAQATSVG